MNPPIEWLLQGDSWVEFRTRVDLLGQSACDEEVLSSRQFMVKDPKIKTIVSELSGWPCVVISSHKSAGQPFHKLTFLADLGLKANDAEMDTIIPRILKHQSTEGPFQLPITIPPQYGGSGNEQWGWALCDAPLVVYALIKFGLEKDPQVQLVIDYMAGLLCDNGWRCVVSKELGNFRGPGRKDDPCPFATLAMLKALSESAIWKDSQACHIGAETLLTLWAESDNRHPYMFFMGTDFRKLKVPFVWYDLIHVLDVLSRFSWLSQDERLRDMLAVLKGKSNQEGYFTPESIWTVWKEWEFGQKRDPSRWLTLMAWRIINRIEAVS